jgi:hypothetical protein
MSSTPPPPSRAAVESWFVAVLDGSRSRDAADRWAHQRMLDPEEDIDVDETVWWGLDILCGIDLRPGPDAPYLHNDEQVGGWLREFRARCAERP